MPRKHIPLNLYTKIESNVTMKEFENDILSSSKEMKGWPFTVPDGYFDKLKSEARKCTKPQVVHVSPWARLAPYAGIAAMFLFILTLGKIFIKDTSVEESTSLADQVSSYEDYMVFNDMATDLSVYCLENEDLALNTLCEEDIIEYLIYIGATEQYIEYNNE